MITTPLQVCFYSHAIKTPTPYGANIISDATIDNIKFCELNITRQKIVTRPNFDKESLRLPYLKSNSRRGKKLSFIKES